MRFFTVIPKTCGDKDTLGEWHTTTKSCQRFCPGSTVLTADGKDCAASCPSGSYTDPKTNQCKTCTTCEEGSFFLKECDADSDAICSNCPTLINCLQNETVCTDSAWSIGNPEVKSVCGSCASGEYYDSGCQPCTDFSSTHCDITVCSTFENAKCDKCLDDFFGPLCNSRCHAVAGCKPNQVVCDKDGDGSGGLCLENECQDGFAWLGS
eukprot:Pgem_evm1s2381